MATAMRKITIPIKNESTGTTTNEEYTFITPEEMDRKADTEGYYEEMTVGDAEQLVSSQYVTDSVPYLYRTTGGSADVGNREYMESIVGGTVAWNQLIQNGDFSNGTNGWYKASGNISASNGEAEVTIGGAWNNDIRQTRPIYNGHVYFMRFSAKADSALSGNVRATFTAVTGTSITASTPMLTTSYQTREYIDKCRADQSDIRVTLSDNASAYVGQKYYTKNVNLIDLTQMFGTTIADYIYSLEQANEGAGVAWFKKLFPNAYYPYNAGELKHVSGVSGHVMTGKNMFCHTDVRNCYITNGAKLKPSSADRTVVMRVIGGQTYSLSGTRMGTVSGQTDNFMACAFTENPVVDTTVGRLIFSADSSNTLNKTFTLNDDECYLAVKVAHINKSNFGDTVATMQLEFGSSITAFEPYKTNTYPLDSTLTLRGIPKLDAQNNLYYDGDVYKHDGTVERRYGVITYDGSTDEPWHIQSAGSTMFYIENSGLKKGPNYSGEIICDKLKTTRSHGYMTDDYIITGYADVNNNYPNQNWIYARANSSITELSAFKTWLQANPITLVYELATPTTEEAEPFQEVQICDDFGTEEFVSTSIVPVGHNTEYPANLRDKLQHLPNLADADGYYMIKQTNKQMSLEHFRIPKAPTEDGTWVLKAVVSGGTPTYTWESEAVENG